MCEQGKMAAEDLFLCDEVVAEKHANVFIQTFYLINLMGNAR